MKTLISILASMALALGAAFTHADDHAAPSAPVGMVYGLDVSDPQAFAAAMTKYWGSPTGEKNPGIAILRQVVAGGESPISHVVSVVYPPTRQWMSHSLSMLNQRMQQPFRVR